MQMEIKLPQRSPATPQLGRHHEENAPGHKSEFTSSCQCKKWIVFLFTYVVLAKHLHTSVRDLLPIRKLYIRTVRGAAESPRHHSTALQNRLSPTHQMKLEGCPVSDYLLFETPEHGKQLVNKQLYRKSKSKQFWLFFSAKPLRKESTKILQHPSAP